MPNRCHPVPALPLLRSMALALPLLAGAGLATRPGVSGDPSAALLAGAGRVVAIQRRGAGWAVIAERGEIVGPTE